jgi:predicted DNA-binding antitoxin AbrB/MazE fold protein
MTQTINAVFENGILRPLEALPLAEGQEVRITVESGKQAPTPSPAQTAHVLELAAKVYEGLSPEEIDEIESHIKRRPNFFSRPVETE